MSRQVVVWGLFAVIVVFFGLGVYYGFASHKMQTIPKIKSDEKNTTNTIIESSGTVLNQTSVSEINKIESVKKVHKQEDVNTKTNLETKRANRHKSVKASVKKEPKAARQDTYDFSKSIYSEKRVAPDPSIETVNVLRKIIEGKPRYKQLTLRERMKKAGVIKGDRVFIRIFKKERILELWMKSEEIYHKVYTYPICAYSGKLGPKQREGDMQSPEGFYKVPYGNLNPNSHYHLSFNLGYPNEYDRSHGRTGSYLMVHGKCASVGCYAMTDSKIEEIYGMVEAALLNGQNEVPVHSFPFKMSKYNINKYKNSKWYSFWLNLKQGYDMFERNHIPPSVDVVDRRYIFSY